MRVRHLTIEKSNEPEEVIRARIAELKRRLNKMAGGRAEFGTMPGMPPQVEEAFLLSVLEFEESHRGCNCGGDPFDDEP